LGELALVQQVALWMRRLSNTEKEPAPPAWPSNPDNQKGSQKFFHENQMAALLFKILKNF
jgi:hypothetical protein